MWFEQNAERWDREQTELTNAGITFQVDENLKTQGILRLNLLVTDQSALKDIPSNFLPLKLTVTFPMGYPFFRPMVYAQEIDLPRHQNFIEKNLCLLPRSSSFWLPETTLAEFLTEQLPKVLTQGMVTDPEILKSTIDEQAEPASEYYVAQANAPIILDTSLFDKIETPDKPIQFLGSIKLGIPSDNQAPARMLALECFDKDKISLGKLPASLENIFKSKGTASIYRTNQRPPVGNAQEDYKWLNKLLDEAKEKIHKFSHTVALKNSGTVNNVVGVTFPEEHLPGQLSWGWLFFVTGTLTIKNDQGRSVKQSYNYYAKVNRINTEELTFRIPSLKPIADESIAIFGLGALGAPSAIEFAKNGVGKIKLIDFDIVNAGTTVRWPLGMSVAGMFKTDALEKFIEENYPYVEVQKYYYPVGYVDIGEGELTQEALARIVSLDEILSDVSLVYDATAELGVTHFLSEESKRRKIPFMSLYGTKGVWGGAVMRSIPDATEGCWMCFQHSLSDGTIPTPPANMSGTIQAAGCGDISFIGASFELENIVNAGVRLAVGTMCLNAAGYPNIEDDIGILSLVDENEKPIFPVWKSYKLKKHPECPYCNK